MSGETLRMLAAMGVSIRFAAASDAETLHRFIAELAAYEREPEAVEVTVEQLREQLQQPRPPFECLLAERDGEPCGFALFFHSYSTWRGQRCMYLEDLFVPEAFRGAGVGERLLATLAGLARDRGCPRLEWCVLNWNAAAIGFYEQLGATPRSDWTTYRLTGGPLTQLAQRAVAVGAAPMP